MDALMTWFDLGAQRAPVGIAAEEAMPLLQQLLLYALVVVGVILSEAVAMARSGRPVHVELSPPWVALASVIALVVFPAVWRDIGSMPDASLIVQAGVAAQGGVFWGVLVAGAEKQVHRRASTVSARRSPG